MFCEAAPRWAWLAAQTLGWRPSEFWQSTPLELTTALSDPGADPSGSVPSRDLINTLMERDAHGR